MKRLTTVFTHILFFALAAGGVTAQEATRSTNFLAGLSAPLSLGEAINHALERNSTILKAQSDLEATYGVVVQTRAIAIPKVKMTGEYQATDATERFPLGNIQTQNDQNWSSNIRVVQSLYEGGRVRSALRTAKLTKEQGLLRYQSVVADTILEVQIAYYDIPWRPSKSRCRKLRWGCCKRSWKMRRGGLRPGPSRASMCSGRRSKWPTPGPA